jgi:hypothetical protein
MGVILVLGNEPCEVYAWNFAVGSVSYLQSPLIRCKKRPCPAQCRINSLPAKWRSQRLQETKNCRHEVREPVSAPPDIGKAFKKEEAYFQWSNQLVDGQVDEALRTGFLF